ncbi:hypothetical protein MY04_05975 (plasmid) [Flammeovirga sp. MY04]|uniref:hypothetical protein n=1 Tax=Flammeovirga sp. MY04 TaxID=1191459 RepID=UPI0008062AE3|nr:hypothetical protein [Flammeovirga sp. MY04]ANQ52928.1 hypothetical protein MY04_05975 [Flammeovirga sp. MY04]
MNTLISIESEIKTLLSTEERSWKKIGELMLIVKKEQLFKGSFKNFTAWVNHISFDTKVTSGYIWRIFKASRTFLGIIASDNPKDIHEAKTTPYQLETFSKIEKLAPDDVTYKYAQQIIDGTSNHTDIKLTWEALKSEHDQQFQLEDNEVKKALELKEENAVMLVGEEQSKMNAAEVYEAISIKQDWMKTLCEREFSFIKKMSTPPECHTYKEVTVRIPTEEKTRFGKLKPQRRRFDAIFTLKPYYSAYGDDLLTAGIEIKVSKSDLMGDDKYLDYLGWTNFFFFAVPSHLVEVAQQKIAESGYKELLGIIDAETSEVVQWPERQEPTAENSMKLYRELLFNRVEPKVVVENSYRIK